MNRMMSSGWIAAALALMPLAAHAGDFRLAGDGLAEGHPLPEAQVGAGFGCTGGGQAPALSWTEPPAGTRSFLLTVYDPDAPTGSGFWHWVVLNIPAKTRALPAGAGTGHGLPDGAIENRGDIGAPGYVGACPPPGPMHRYVFTLSALDVDRLDASADSSPALIGFMAGAHTLGRAVLTATYAR